MRDERQLRAVRDTFEVRIDTYGRLRAVRHHPSSIRFSAKTSTWRPLATGQVTERFSDVMWAMQQILFMSFDKRLAVFLLDEVARGGDYRADDAGGNRALPGGRARIRRGC